jgi:hypothetical protein
MLGECGSQVTGGPPLRPRPAEQYWTGFEPLTPTAAVGLRPFQRGKWSPWTGLTLLLSLGPSLPSGSKIRPRRPCPPRARSIGVWRCLTVNSGRSQAGLTCAMGLASGPDEGTGRAFQARDRRGRIRATFHRRITDNSGHLRSTDRAAQPALSVIIAGRPSTRVSLARRKSPGAGSALGPCRNGRAGHQRSPTVQRNRRSLAVQLTQPG